MCSSQSFAPVESHLPPLHCDKISLERVRWHHSTPTSLYLLSSPFYCFNLPPSLSVTLWVFLVFLSCHRITHSYSTDVWRALGEKPPPRGLLSIQGHRLTKCTLQRVECFTRHVMFCNIWCASLQIWCVRLRLCNLRNRMTCGQGVSWPQECLHSFKYSVPTSSVFPKNKLTHMGLVVKFDLITHLSS